MLHAVYFENTADMVVEAILFEVNTLHMLQSRKTMQLKSRFLSRTYFLVFQTSGSASDHKI